MQGAHAEAMRLTHIGDTNEDAPGAKLHSIEELTPLDPL
jgi:hypothetical protein